MKPNILLLTGWGTSCEIWQPMISQLENRFQLHCIKPPWETNSSLSSLSNFDTYVNELAQSISATVYVVAWSLGGLFAIQLATNFPALVDKIFFVSSTPKFITNSSEFGIEHEWFERFGHDFKRNPIQTLRKFLTLQAKGDEFAKTTLQQLRKYCRMEDFDLAECQYGLNLLGKLDLSNELINLSCKSVFIHGECDAVLPCSEGREAASKAKAKFYLVPSAGHAVQVSHPQILAHYISENIN